MKRATLMALLGGLLTGCAASYNLDDGEFADSATGGDSGMHQGDSGPVVNDDPVWFGLDAEVQLLEGQVTAVTTSLRVHPEDTEELLCTDAPAVEVIQDLAVPDPLVFHWVQLTLAEDSGACEGGDRIPRSIRLGLGELYDPIVPGVERHGLGEVQDSLYGAYASFEAPVGDGLEGTTYAYGYAGTELDRAGETTAVETGPLPDGTYLVTAWYLFELLP